MIVKELIGKLQESNPEGEVKGANRMGVFSLDTYVDNGTMVFLATKHNDTKKKTGNGSLV